MPSTKEYHRQIVPRPSYASAPSRVIRIIHSTALGSMNRRDGAGARQRRNAATVCSVAEHASVGWTRLLEHENWSNGVGNESEHRRTTPWKGGSTEAMRLDCTDAPDLRLKAGRGSSQAASRGTEIMGGDAGSGIEKTSRPEREGTARERARGWVARATRLDCTGAPDLRGEGGRVSSQTALRRAEIEEMRGASRSEELRGRIVGSGNQQQRKPARKNG